MPVTEPGPVGTFSAYPAHPVPTRSAAGSAMVLAIAGADEFDIAELDEVAAEVLEASGEDELEHAETPRIAAALRAAAAIAFR